MEKFIQKIYGCIFTHCVFLAFLQHSPDGVTARRRINLQSYSTTPPRASVLWDGPAPATSLGR